MNGSEDRQLGELTAKFEALEQRFEEHRMEAKEHRAEVKADMREIRGSLQSVLDKLNGWQGGWKAMAVVASVAGAFGAAAVKFIKF